jgi:hypothetical protein
VHRSLQKPLLQHIDIEGGEMVCPCTLDGDLRDTGRRVKNGFSPCAAHRSEDQADGRR